MLIKIDTVAFTFYHIARIHHTFSLSVLCCCLLLLSFYPFLSISLSHPTPTNTHIHTLSFIFSSFVCVLIWEQAMVTLRGMVEHRLSNVFKQHLTLLWFYIRAFSPFSPFPIPHFSTFPFYDMFFLFLN